MKEINRRLVGLLLASIIIFAVAFFASCADNATGGANGLNGISGTDGVDGTGGDDGTGGTDGEDGTSGTDGDEGVVTPEGDPCDPKDPAPERNKPRLSFTNQSFALTVAPTSEFAFNCHDHLVNTVQLTSSYLKALVNVVPEDANDTKIYWPLQKINFTEGDEVVTNITNAATSADIKDVIKKFLGPIRLIDKFGDAHELIPKGTVNRDNEFVSDDSAGEKIEAVTAIPYIIRGFTMREITFIYSGKNTFTGTTLKKDGLTALQEAVKPLKFNFHVAEFESEAGVTASIDTLASSIAIGYSAAEVAEKLNNFFAGKDINIKTVELTVTYNPIPPTPAYSLIKAIAVRK